MLKIIESLGKKLKNMEKDSMLLDRKKKYCSNVDTTQSNLHIQCNPCQKNTSIVHRARRNNPKICMEPEKALNSQSNPGKENWGHLGGSVG